MHNPAIVSFINQKKTANLSYLKQMDLKNGITQRWSAIWFSYVDAFWGTWFVLCILKTETFKIICEKDKYFLQWFKRA